MIGWFLFLDGFSKWKDRYGKEEELQDKKREYESKKYKYENEVREWNLKNIKYPQLQREIK